MNIEYRLVSCDADYDAVRRLRYDVYAIEEALRVDGMDHDKRMLGDALDKSSMIVAAFEGAQAVASVRCTPMTAVPRESYLRERFTPEVFPVEASRQVLIGRLMVRELSRGLALSVPLLSAVNDHLVAFGIRIAFLECNPRLLPLYEQFGARQYRPGIADSQCGLMTPMVYLVDDVEHARKMGSPFTARDPLSNTPETVRLSDWFEATFGDFTRPASLRFLPAQGRAALLSLVAASRSHLFNGMSEQDIGTVLRNSAVLETPAATPILPCGNVGTDMYLLLRGCVAIGRRAQTTAPVLLYPGQFFGGESFVCGDGPKPFRTDAVSVGAVRLLSISTESIRRMYKAHPRLVDTVVAAVRSHSVVLRLDRDASDKAAQPMVEDALS